MTGRRLPAAIRDNSLSLGFGALFLLVLAGQALAGLGDYNERALAVGGTAMGLGRYLTSSSFAVDVAENWQSEYLQFLLYITATVWLLQRGSPESKQLGKQGRESDEQQRIGRFADADSPRWVRRGGWRRSVYAHSLGLVMGAIFVASWLIQSIAGWADHNREQLAERQDPVSWLRYVGEYDFWNRTLQNWQSELLAVGSMAIFAVYLRERGSPESKPVGAAHRDTADTG